MFGRMYQNGHIYKGLKPVYWCPHDETALAEAEIEYKDDPCTTVYVKFPMHDDQGKLGHLDHSKLYFVIWTTTVWTLPGNLAIALGGYGTGATAQSCLARLVPLTKQILFYPTEASDHGIISPVCAFFVVYDTIHPDSPPSI